MPGIRTFGVRLVGSSPPMARTEFGIGDPPIARGWTRPTPCWLALC